MNLKKCFLLILSILLIQGCSIKDYPNKIEVTSVNYSSSEIDKNNLLFNYDILITNYSDKNVEIKSVQTLLNVANKSSTNEVNKELIPGESMHVKGNISFIETDIEPSIKEIKINQVESYKYH
ncbi:hypothetical protein [Paenibacillus sp. J22TS3]|uniref:hypothetical protein n=1 Tax=Paenibacillus sp. J22TS3 TaxID=2807192 RepID=UPI001B10E60C|nr:hypothetical protein [Paenibacillus sp. J22TS3]GIP22583.1 hypothetical protein J22TS3_28580 [Paenibacillus sp. J22TS3]